MGKVHAFLCSTFSNLSWSLLVASEYDPLSIMEKLSAYLAGSAPIVVHSAYLQVGSMLSCSFAVIIIKDYRWQILAELQSSLRDKPEYLGPSVTEGWLRRYQVIDTSRVMCKAPY